LAFFPLETKELKKYLTEIRKNNNAVADIQLAMKYINDFLFNVDPRIAEVFINNDIKEHFNLKAADIKALPSYQKELHREFSSTREARQVKSESGSIPLWYEVGSRGTWKFYPRVLADYLAKNEPIFYCGDSYYFYENGVYVSYDEKRAMNYISEYMSDKYTLAAEIRDTEFQWSIKINKSTREINVNPYLMNFENGLYDLLTDRLIPHAPNILSTIRLGGNYNPDALCPVFLKYLGEVLAKSEHIIAQEIMGYMLVAITKAQKSFFIIGKEHSGKSTFLYIVQDLLLRHDNCSNLAWQELDEKFATVQLYNKLANIFADLPAKNIQETGTFKAITGEDYISAQHKFKEYFSFKAFCKLIFSGEKLPNNYVDRGGGFYRRLLILTFDHQIPFEQKDGHLREKLAMETDGIIAGAMIGLKRLMANDWQFTETDSTRAALNAYKAENSNVIAFVEECCVVEPDGEIIRDELFRTYGEWCSTNGTKACGQRRFYGEIDGITGVTRSQTAVNRLKSWKGIRMK